MHIVKRGVQSVMQTLRRERRLLTSSLMVFIVAWALYSFKITQSYRYDQDFARDLSDIYTIVHGDLALIGPKSTFGVVFTGPFYYYMFVPIAWLTNMQIPAILLMNAFYFAAALAVLFFLLARQISTLRSAIVTTALLLLPTTIVAARNPWNGYSYLPLLLVTFACLVTLDLQRRLLLFVLGLLIGISFSIEYAYFPLFVGLVLFVWLRLKRKRDLSFFICGSICGFAPLIAFEARNHFFMIKATLASRTYATYFQSPAYRNPWQQLWFVLSEMQKISLIHPLIIVTILLALYCMRKDRRERDLITSACLALVLLLGLARFSFAPHYLLPVLYFLIFVFLYVSVQTGFFVILSVYIVLCVLAFPRYAYQPSSRPYRDFQQAVDFVIDHKLISPKTKFNVLQVRPDTLLAPYGNEYRYFFLSRGYKPMPIAFYRISDVLIIFSELRNTNVKGLNSWEINEFEKKYFPHAKKYTFNSREIYVIPK